MKVKQLIEKLNSLDPEAEVFTYIQEAEEFGKCSEAFEAKPEDLPYAKGDQPNHDGTMVLISGWCI